MVATFNWPLKRLYITRSSQIHLHETPLESASLITSFAAITLNASYIINAMAAISRWAHASDIQSYISSLKGEAKRKEGKWWREDSVRSFP